jgi:hypothetical protein
MPRYARGKSVHFASIGLALQTAHEEGFVERIDECLDFGLAEAFDAGKGFGLLMYNVGE